MPLPNVLLTPRSVTMGPDEIAIYFRNPTSV